MTRIVRACVIASAVFSLAFREASASWKLSCAVFGPAYMDPIVVPGGRNYHSHYIGGSLGFSDYIVPDLLNGSLNTCNNKGDFSNYWFPPLYRTDTLAGERELMRPHVDAYYLFNPSEQQYLDPQTVAQPLSMIIGKYSPSALPAENNTLTFWTRINSEAGTWNESGRYGWPESVTDATDVKVRYDFPSCWNGGPYAADQSHLTYKNPTTYICPTGWLQLPTIRLETKYTLKTTASWTNFSAPFVFSSGGETTAHADAVVLWDPVMIGAMYLTCNSTKGIACPLNDERDAKVQNERADSYVIPEEYQEYPAPTTAPSPKPTKTPTTKPTKTPTNMPSKKPTNTPTTKPTKTPTNTPTKKPTNTPTTKPTKAPTGAPTRASSAAA